MPDKPSKGATTVAPTPPTPAREPGSDDGPVPNPALATVPKGGALLAGPWAASGLSGAGMENLTAADFAIPFISVLQAMSPECTKGAPEYKPSAQPGMFLDSVTGELTPGETGLLIVPCSTKHNYVEWIPRDKGGGFVAEHDTRSDYVVKAIEAAGKRIGRIPVKALTPNTPDTELVETFSLFALLLDKPEDEDPKGFAIIAFTSTKIKPYRDQMTQVRTVKGGGPLFANRLRVVTVPAVNKRNQHFFNVELRPALKDLATSRYPLPTTADQTTWHPMLRHGFSFLKEIQAGSAKAAYDTVKGDTAAGSDATEGHF